MDSAKVTVTVRRAEGVLAKDKGGTSDPFAQVVLGKQKFKTRVIEKSLHPEWDETFTMRFDPSADDLSLDIVLYDHDKGFIAGSSSEFLGAVSIDLSTLAVDTLVSDWHDLVWIKTYQKKQEAVTGRILIDVRLEINEAVDRVESTRTSSDLSTRKMSGMSGIGAASEAQNRLLVHIKKAENLIAKDKGGTSDPFCQVHVGNETKKTEVKPKTLNPDWNQTLTFDNKGDSKSIDLVLYDQDKGFFSNSNEYLGSAMIDLHDLITGDILSDWFELRFDPKFGKDVEQITGRIYVEVEYEGAVGMAPMTPGTGSVRSPSRGKSEVGARSVEVTVLKAEGIVAKDRGGTSDPFCELVLGNHRKKTKVIAKSLTPEWNETFILDFEGGRDSVLSVVIYDHDRSLLGGSSAEFLGSCDIALDPMGVDDPVRQWYKLVWDEKFSKAKEKVTGRVLIRTLVRPLTVSVQLDISKIPRAPRDVNKAVRNQERGVGLLEVTVISAERLPAVDRGGSSDPFVELLVGGNKQKTKTIKKTLSPEWNEPFSIEVPAGASSLECSVYDENFAQFNTFMGTVVVCLDQLEVGKDTVQVFPLGNRSLAGSIASGNLRLLLNYFAQGKDTLRYPEVDMGDVRQKAAESGAGSCTVTIVAAMDLPVSDPKNSGLTCYAEARANDYKAATSVVEGSRQPVFNAPVLLEITPDCQVVEIVVFEKASALNIRRGDVPIGIATILLASLPPNPSFLWYDLMPVRPGDARMGAIKVVTDPHFIPELKLNRPRREVSRVRANASKGLGTLEMVVIAAKQLPSAEGRDREPLVIVTAGNRKVTIESGKKGLNPVWNKPVVLEISPDVEEVKLEVLDRLGNATNGGKNLGVITVKLDDLKEGEEYDFWSDLKTGETLRAQGSLRVMVNYVQKIAYIDPAERGLIQTAIGTAEILIISARSVGHIEGMVPTEDSGVALFPSTKPPSSVSAKAGPPSKFNNKPGVSFANGSGNGSSANDPDVSAISPFSMTASPAVSNATPAPPRSGPSGLSSTEEGPRLLAEGSLVRIQAKLGTMKRITQVSRATPHPHYNEKLILKIPHPAAVLEIAIVEEDVTGEISLTPYATCEVPIAQLKDGETKDAWYPLKAKRVTSPRSSLSRQLSAAESSISGEDTHDPILGSIQILIKISRNWGFNLSVLGGLIACPWQCGTHFEADQASEHFIQCPLAPDPTAVVSCVHLGLGCSFRGPRFGMKDHLVICPFEPVKEVVRGYLKENVSLKKALETQEEEIAVLRFKIQNMEIAAEKASKKAGGAASGAAKNGGESPASRFDLLGTSELGSLGPAGHASIPEGGDPSAGAGLVEVDALMEVEQQKIIKWMPNTNTVTLEGHTDGVMALGHSVEHKKMFSGSMDRTVRVWDISMHDPLCDGELKGHRGGVTSIAVGGHRLVTGSVDATLRVWDVATLKEQAKFQGHVGMVHGLMLLNDMCFSVSQDKSIKIWDLRLRQCVTTMETKSRGCYGFAIHELKLLSASGSKIVTWDLRMLAASTMNEQQRLEFGRYDTLTGNCAGTYGHQMVGDRLYTSAVDNSVRLWDLRSLQEKSKIVGHSDFVRALACAGERLLTASDDKTIRVWDLEFHDCQKVLKGHTSYINALLVARARLYSASMDKTIRIWE